MSSILKGLVAEKHKDVPNEPVNEVNNRAYELEDAFRQAKNITKQIGYDRTVNEILTNIELLVEKYNIDKDAFQTAEMGVKNAQRQLEAAIYGLDEIFQDAMKNAQWDNDELTENDTVQEAVGVNDLADELFDRYPNLIRRYGHEVVGNAILNVSRKNSNDDMETLINKIVLSLKETNEGQIYSTGGGPGEGRRKYRIKPAGL